MTASELILKIATIAVIIMIVISFVLLVFVLVNKDDFSKSEDNVIGLKSDMIEIDDPEDVESKRFNVSNMFPGDSVTKSYKVNILDSEVEYISFVSKVISDSVSMADDVYITLTVDDAANPYYRTKASEMPEEGVTVPTDGEIMTFHVTVTLDTSAGNECQNGELALDLFFGGSGVDYSDGRVDE